MYARNPPIEQSFELVHFWYLPEPLWTLIECLIGIYRTMHIFCLDHDRYKNHCSEFVSIEMGTHVKHVTKAKCDLMNRRLRLLGERGIDGFMEGLMGKRGKII